MDQVVENVLEAGVAHVVLAVMHDEQWITARFAIARRQIDADPTTTKGWAVVDNFVEVTSASVGVAMDPGRHLVANPVRDRVGAERIARSVGIERIFHPRTVAAANDLKLVLDARRNRQFEGQEPNVGVLDSLEILRRRQSVHPMLEMHRIGVAAVDERDRRAFDDGKAMPSNEAIDVGGRARTGDETRHRGGLWQRNHRLRSADFACAHDQLLVLPSSSPSEQSRCASTERNKRAPSAPVFITTCAPASMARQAAGANRSANCATRS